MTAYHMHLIIQRTKEKTSHIQQSVPPLKSALIPLSLNCPHNYLGKKKKKKKSWVPLVEILTYMLLYDDLRF